MLTDPVYPLVLAVTLLACAVTAFARYVCMAIVSEGDDCE